MTSPELKRRQSTSDGRGRSSSGVRDGIGNLNRWSQSTTSSRGSTTHARSNSFSRRLSFGGAAGFSFGNAQTSSPGRSGTGEPTADAVSPRATTGKRPSRDPFHPATSLPPIVPLPALQPIDYNRASPFTSTESHPPSAVHPTTAVRTAAPDYLGGYWERSGEQEARDRHLFLQSRIVTDKPHASSSSSTAQPVGGSPSRRQRPDRERSSSRGHSRHHSQAGKTSSGTTSSDRSRERAGRPPSQKAMLSVALQKANTAVLLDNAQNVEGAMQAYSEACSLLQQVMLRSTADEDKRKLEAIRQTYALRVNELEKMVPQSQQEGKALPARPVSTELREFDHHSTGEDEMVEIGTAMMTRIINDDSYRLESSRQIPASQVPQRRESLLPSVFEPHAHANSRSTAESTSPPLALSQSPVRAKITGRGDSLGVQMEHEHMPAPLSASRERSLLTGVRVLHHAGQSAEGGNLPAPATSILDPDHRRTMSVESMSWLDMIDDSVSSSASSVHSRTSSLAVRRKHIRAASGKTEAEFDAALDAAVEAAYNDGFEPMDDPTPLSESMDYEDDIVADVDRRVELAKERERWTADAAEVHLDPVHTGTMLPDSKTEFYRTFEADENADDSEEEERMLEEMTRGLAMDDFEFGLQSKSALPRESDSSGFSGRTWNSSIGSNFNTAMTSLSTVAESVDLPDVPVLLSKTMPSPHPPPNLALPQPLTIKLGDTTKPLPGSSTSTVSAGSQGVRSRRLSGQNPKQLKIETTTRSPPLPPIPLSVPQTAPAEHAPNFAALPPATVGAASQSRQASDSLPSRPPVSQSARQTSSPFPGPSAADTVSPPTPTFNRVANSDGDHGAVLPRSGSPGRTQSRTGLRKNFSSSSLKNLKHRNLSVSAVDEGSDISPATPSSGYFGPVLTNKDTSNKLPAMPPLPTPIATSFRDKMNGAPTGGLYLFDNNISSPQSPVSSDQDKAGAPTPLEPCPNEVLLRPFWLMRALYQTLAHPRGGYLSNKLFVPTDIWRVKGVKIRNLEDKTSNCDYLTAALQKLAQVDTCDADAVLEEMQALEGVLEHVQATLTKKLGNEVGVQGSGILFKDAPLGLEADPAGAKVPNLPNKSSSFSWRRLRSKNSGAPLTGTYPAKPANETIKDSAGLSTLPMTSLNKVRFAKRDLTSVQFTGPHANYMAALARLFDAAQVIDQIARQVDDPGLRHADKTQVGLELCTRHAAEFFGFYICRFVLADVSLLLDKFIKRGSEWVLV